MLSIADIANLINDQIDFPGAKKYSIAQTIYRDKDKLPALVKRDGSAEYVGFDDKYPISWYHKVNGLNAKQIAAGGFGRQQAAKSSVFTLSMIVFINRKRLKKYPDEVVAEIQEQTPELINKSIRVTYNNTILNDQQVYSQEYLSDTYRLGPEHSLFQINYTVEVARDACFNTCSK